MEIRKEGNEDGADQKQKTEVVRLMMMMMRVQKKVNSRLCARDINKAFPSLNFWAFKSEQGVRMQSQERERASSTVHSTHRTKKPQGQSRTRSAFRLVHHQNQSVSVIIIILRFTSVAATLITLSPPQAQTQSEGDHHCYHYYNNVL